MSIQDRRSGSERRDTNRYAVNFDIEWEGSQGRKQGTLSDLSYVGCFVLSSGDIEDGDPVRLFIPLADGIKAQFDGTVANHVFEIGFGIKFKPLSAVQRELLDKLARETDQR